MSWASQYIKQLGAGEEVSFRPKGNSMTGKIESGQLCTLSPNVSNLATHDIVLCRVKGAHYLHLISAIKGSPPKYQISNNKKHVNGWISKSAIFGKLIKID